MGDGLRRLGARSALLAVLLLLLNPLPTFALTPAGTVISNTATTTYDGGTVTSNTVRITVAQIAGVGITPLSASQSAYQGATVYYAATVTNAGNGSDVIQLRATSASGWPVVIYRDDNGDGLRQATEVTAIANTDALSAGGQAACLVGVSIPATGVGSDGEILTATSAFNPTCAASASYVTIAAAPPTAPVAAFSASPTTGQAPLTVSFTDLSTGSPTVWSWSFGDGSISAAQNPSHTYASAGSYAVTLTVGNANGQTTETKAGYITVSGPAPVAQFSASPTTGEAPLLVNFADLSTGSPTSWSWDFGDGQTSPAQSPGHYYTTPGTYTVSLTVANAAGQSTATKSGYITVSVSAIQFSAEFSAVPTNGPAPLSVAFTDLSTGSPTAWRWDFGDGQWSADRNPVHIYQSAGSYTVSLSVIGVAGVAASSKPAYIVVGFSDVPENYWAYNAIMSCLTAGIVTGYPDGKFHPEVKVSREQVAVYLSRAFAGGDANVPEGPAQPSFQDVPTDYWAYKYIEYVKGLKIILGYPDGEFLPAALVDRAQMAVFLARSLVDPTGDEGLASYTPPATPTFQDVTPTNEWSWCYKHVEFVVARGIVQGYPDKSYRPSLLCTRDQLAVFLAKAFGLI